MTEGIPVKMMQAEIDKAKQSIAEGRYKEAADAIDKLDEYVGVLRACGFWVDE